MTTNALLTGLAAGLLVGLPAGFLLAPSNRTDDGLPDGAGGRSRPAEPAARPDDLAAARIADLEARLAEATASLRAATSRTALPAATADAESGAAEAPETPEPLTARIAFPGMEAPLAKIDWDQVGRSAAKMQEMMRALEQARAEGEPLDFGAVAELQKLNAELVAMVGPLTEAGVPGLGPNGSFTHPVVAANMLDAALTKAGLGLDSAQTEALQRLAARYAGEYDQERSRLGDGSAKLDQLLAEDDVKERFYEEARALLDPEQAARLRPGSDALGTDLFSPGLVYAQFLAPAPVRGVDDVVDNVSTQLRRDLDLAPEQEEAVGALVAAWAGTIDFDSLQSLEALKNGVGGPSLAQTRAAARRQAELFRQLQTQAGLTGDQLRKLAGIDKVFVPLRR